MGAIARDGGQLQLVRPQVDPCLTRLHVGVVRVVDRNAVPVGPAIFDPPVEHVHGAEKVHHERRRGPIEDLCGRAALLDAAVVHDDHLVGEFECLLLVVRDEHARHADLVVEAAEPLPQLDPHLRVERTERFVEQQHLRSNGERPGEGDALPLAARQLRGLAATEALESHKPEQFLDSGGDLGTRHLPHPQPERDVLEHAHVPEEGVVLEHEAHAPLPGVRLGDVLAVLLDEPRVGGFEARDDAQERRLAGSRWPEQCDEAAVIHVERHAIESLEGAEGLRYVAQVEAHDVLLWPSGRLSGGSIRLQIPLLGGELSLDHELRDERHECEAGQHARHGHRRRGAVFLEELLDPQRHRVGRTGDVAADDVHRPELPERPRVGKHDPVQEGPADVGQRDPREDLPAAGPERHGGELLVGARRFHDRDQLPHDERERDERGRDDEAGPGEDHLPVEPGECRSEEALTAEDEHEREPGHHGRDGERHVEERHEQGSAGKAEPCHQPRRRDAEDDVHRHGHRRDRQ